MVQASWPHPWLRPDLGRWPRQVAEAQQLQRQLASQVSVEPFAAEVELVAGADVSVRRGQDKATAAVVVLSFPGLTVSEVAVAEGKLDFPYIPGLLSFREAPLVVEAFARLKSRPQLLLVDGQGLAHPRRFGLACHLGLLLDLPTIGCAKSRLWGHSEAVGLQPGQRAPLTDGEEVIGAALRTREGVKPVYVSVGHQIDLEGACAWVRRLCRGFRLPEPLRQAHRAASQGKMV